MVVGRRALVGRIHRTLGARARRKVEYLLHCVPRIVILQATIWYTEGRVPRNHTVATRQIRSHYPEALISEQITNLAKWQNRECLGKMAC